MGKDRKPQPLETARKVDRLCDQFEQEWKAGRRPRIEDFLKNAEAEEVEELLRALLEVEVELVQESGDAVSPGTLNDRFSQYPAVVADVLDSVQRKRRDSIPPKENAGAGKRETTVNLRDASIDTSVTRKAADSGRLKAAPKTLGRFEIIEALGEGAFGTVYRALDPQLHREVALKVPRAGVLETQEDVDRFLQEARAAATLRHPHICPIYDFGKIDDDYFIVMAYISGKPLSSVLANTKPISNRKIAVAVRKIALALDEAHKHKVVHRDLKPSNIMIDKKGDPVVMDFGLARRVSGDEAQLTHSGAILGTPAYMPPEQARGHSKDVGPASDIYSLGVILYELLCGRRPFGGSVAEVFAKILYEEPQPPSAHMADVDPALEAISMKAMAKQPEERFASMADFADALADYVRGQRGGEGDSSSDSQEVVTSAATKTAPAKKKAGAKSKSAGGSGKTASGFDPYHKWLGIPPSEQPPNHYRLLGLHLFESDPDVIDAAAERQMTYLHQIAAGPHVADAQRVLNELAAARLCLLNAEKKGAYDAELREELDRVDRDDDASFDDEFEEFAELPKRIRAASSEPPWWKTVDRKLVALGGVLLIAVLGVVIIIRTPDHETVVTTNDEGATTSVAVTGDETVVQSTGSVDVVVGPRTDGGDIAAGGLGDSFDNAMTLEFDDVEEQVSFSKFPANLKGPLTVDLWLEPKSFSGKTDVVKLSGLLLVRNGDKWQPWMFISDHESITQKLITPIADDRLVHLAVVADSNRLDFYVNGTPQGEKIVLDARDSSRNGPKLPGQFELIARWESRLSLHAPPGKVLEMRVSDIARYDDAFTPQKRFDADEHTLALYHFNAGNGGTVKDVSGKGYDGEITGAKWVRRTGVESRADDVFAAGSKWQGERTYLAGDYQGVTVPYWLYVDKVNGGKFEGHIFDNGPRKNRATIDGEIQGGTVSWRERPDHRPWAELLMTGTLTGDTIDLTFQGNYNKGRNRRGKGRLTLVSSSGTKSVGPRNNVAGLAAPAQLHRLQDNGQDVSTLALAFMPDGRRLVTANDDKLLRVWDVESGRLVDELDTRTAAEDVAVSPDSRYALWGGVVGFAGIWDIENHRLVHSLKIQGKRPGTLMGVAYSPDGKLVAACGHDGFLRIWEAKTGREINSIRTKAPKNGGSAVKFTPDGGTVLVKAGNSGGEGVVQVFDVKSGALKHEFKLGPNSDGGNGLAISPDGRRFATGNFRNWAMVFDLETGKKIGDGAPGGRDSARVAYSPDSRWLAVGHMGGTVQLLDAKTLQEKFVLRHENVKVAGLAFSPDGKYLASATTKWGNLNSAGAPDARIWRMPDSGGVSGVSNAGASPATAQVYDAATGVAPEAAGWTFHGDDIGEGSVEFKSGRLLHNATGGGTSFWTAKRPADSDDAEDGIFMQTTARLVKENRTSTAAGVTLLDIALRSDGELWAASVVAHSAGLAIRDAHGKVLQSLPLETTDGEHTYRLELADGAYWLFIDQELKAFQAAASLSAVDDGSSSSPEIVARFGDTFGAESSSETEYQNVAFGPLAHIGGPTVLRGAGDFADPNFSDNKDALVMVYDASEGELPGAAGWQFFEEGQQSGAAAIESGQLVHNAGMEGRSYWEATIPSALAPADAGVFMETTVQLRREQHVNQRRGVNLVELAEYTANRSRSVALYAWEDRVFLFDINDRHVSGSDVEMDTTDGFHTYRVELKDDRYWIFVDGIQKSAGEVRSAVTRNEALGVLPKTARPLPQLWGLFGDTTTFSGSSVVRKSVVFGSLGAWGGPSADHQPTDYDHLLTGYWQQLPISGEEEKTPVFAGTPSFQPSGGRVFGSRPYRDVIVRAEIKKHSGWHPSLTVRKNLSGDYKAYFDRFQRFGIGKSSPGPWKDLQVKTTAEEYKDFFEWTFAAVDDQLTVYVDGKKILGVQDSAYANGFAGFGVLKSKADFHNVRIMDLTRGPFRPKGITDAEATAAAGNNESVGEKSAPVALTRPSPLSGRAAAQWILDAGGQIHLQGSGGWKTRLEPPASLPRRPFNVTTVDLPDNRSFQPHDLFRLSNLTRVVQLNLNDVTLSDESLSVLSRMPKLQRLYLSRTGLTDKCLPLIARAGELRQLHLPSTKITDEGMAALAGLDKLYLLFIWNTSITDEGLRHISRIPALELLNVDKTFVSDHGLAHLARHPKLKNISLAGTKVTDEGLKHLHALKTLRRLKVTDTQVTAAGVRDLQAALPDCEVEAEVTESNPVK